MTVNLRNLFLSGLLVLLPIVATVYVVITLFRWADGWLGVIIHRYVPVLAPIPGLGIILTVLLILVTGMVAQNILGRQLIEMGERILYRLPIVRRIYMTVKQMMEAFMQQDQGAFKRVGLVEYPRKGVYSIGLVTGESRGELSQRLGEKTIHIFVPTTPNPTSGFLVLVPESDVIYLDMPIEGAMRLIISGGIVQIDEELRNVKR